MKAPKITIIEENTLYDRWASLKEYRLHYKSDHVDAEVTRVVFDSGNGAAVLLYDPVGKTLLFVRQFRFGAYFGGATDPLILEVCAGIVEDNEPRDTAVREALEETGYVIDDVDHVGTVYATPGAHTEMLDLYIAQYDREKRSTQGGGLLSEHEDIEVVELTYDEVGEMLKQRQINDAKTLILAQHWFIHYK